MSLTTKNSSGLVGGKIDYSKSAKVKLTRDIIVGGAPHKAGDEITIQGVDLKYVLGMKMGVLIENKKPEKESKKKSE